MRISDLTDEEIKEMSPKEIRKVLRDTRKKANRERLKDSFKRAPKYVTRGSIIGGTIGGVAGALEKRSPKSIMTGVIGGSTAGALTGLSLSSFKGFIDSGKKGLLHKELDAAKRIDKIRGENRWAKKARSRMDYTGKTGNPENFIKRQDIQ